MKTSIYEGEVIHQRFAPKRHRLSYHIFQVLLDLDRLDDDLKPLRIFSRNRFNLFSFCDRDHGPDQASSRTAPLKDRMTAMLSERGQYRDGDHIFLLAMPRILGFVFNPISLYFAQKTDGTMKAVVYEVNNTFGDRHSYVMPVHGAAKRIHQNSEKKLHVSPFMDMNMAYEFDLIAPESTFALKIQLHQQQPDRSMKHMLFAGFTALYEPLRDAALARLFVVMPLMTLGVVIGIHWEALLLYIKGMRLKPKPPTDRSSVSVSR